MNRRKNIGFTFIELIIAVTIFSIIAVSIYSVFRSGVRLWYRVSPMIQDNQSLRLFFNTIASDLKNSVQYLKNGENFEGDRRKMSFMTLVEVSEQGFPSRMELAKVIYKLDSTAKSVRKGIATRLEGFAEDYAKFSDILNDIEDKDFAFEYCYKMGSSPIDYSYEWKSEWDDKDKESGRIPRGIKIKVRDNSKVVFIPTGTLGGEDAF
ncbi:MAG: prepilin-type N-terminal cleavage/methylation domain-containing protein [Candidatus Omnitrophota bacterium]|nr:prepilin-type N-terminal cleavage/methylation domain-containing protein [Candidatus Omnitrophota bacterium]